VAISLIVGGRWFVRNEEMMASCRLELFIMASDKNSCVPTSQGIIFLVVRMWCFVNEGVRECCGRLSFLYFPVRGSVVPGVDRRCFDFQ
jgi:hypothetical protein